MTQLKLLAQLNQNRKKQAASIRRMNINDAANIDYVAIAARRMNAASPISVLKSTREERVRKLRKNVEGLERVVRDLGHNLEKEREFMRELQVALDEWETSGRTQPLRLPVNENPQLASTMANARNIAKHAE